MSATHRCATMHIDRTQVGTLVARIFDPARTLPIVLVSRGTDTGEPRVPLTLLNDRFDGLIVVLADRITSDVLTDAVGATYRAFGGAVRVIYPGATVSDHWRIHPQFLTYPGDDPAATAERVVAAVNRHHQGEEVSAPPATRQGPAMQVKPCPPPSAPTPAPAPVRSEPTPVPADPEPTPPPQPATSPLDPDVLAQHVADVTRTQVVAALLDLVGNVGSREETERERSRADAAEQALDALRDRHEHTMRDLSETRTAAERVRRDLESDLRQARAEHQWPPKVYDDPVEQVTYEITQRWLTQFSPCEREEFPLRHFTIGDAFIQSLDSPVVPRSKAIDVAVEVICKRVWKTRPAHPITENGNGSKTLTRGPDIAYRAYIKVESPGAARLLWWECADGSVELVAASHHDDFSAL